MTLTTPMKVILAVVLIGVIGLGFYLLDWQKKMAERTALDQSLAGKQQEYDRIRNETRSLTTLVQENELLTKELAKLTSGMSGGGMQQEDPNEFVPSFIQNIEEVVGEVGASKNDTMEIVSITPGSSTQGPGEKKKDEVPSVVSQVLEKFPKRKFQLSMRGHYESLVAFLDRLGALALQRLVTVDKVSLSPSGGEKTSRPTLTITLPLTAYLKGGG